MSADLAGTSLLYTGVDFQKQEVYADAYVANFLLTDWHCLRKRVSLMSAWRANHFTRSLGSLLRALSRPLVGV